MAWLWLLIPLAAIIGRFIIDYQKNKMKMMDKSRQNEEEVADVRKLVQSLEKRIENLEAIAADEPDEFKAGTGAATHEIEIDEQISVKENQRQISHIAKKRRSK